MYSTIIKLVIAAYMIVVWWILLDKSGDEGWKMFIPIFDEHGKGIQQIRRLHSGADLPSAYLSGHIGIR